MPDVPKELVSAALGAAAGAAGKELVVAALGPPAQEVGEVLRRAVHVALTPIRAGLWPIEKVIEWAETEIPKRLIGISAEQVQPPAPEVFVPALLAMTYTKADDLRALFANLLAKSMDSATADDVHPSFVQVIEQLAPGEARMLAVLAKPHYTAHFYSLAPNTHMVSRDDEIVFPGASDVSDLFSLAGCKADAPAMVSVGNLERLNLVRFSEQEPIGLPAEQIPLQYFPPQARGPLERIMVLTMPMFDHRTLDLTAFGRNFCRCCVDEPATASPRT